MPSRRTHFAVFCLCLALWTVALLVPVPKETASKALGGAEGVFLFGKTLHICAYAFLTLLGGTMSMTRRQRWGVLGLMSFHGFATEFFQQFVNRGASLRDVGLDHAGIALGLIIGWAWWRELCRQPRSPASSAAHPVYNKTGGAGGEI
jgi:VanZ family protein